MSTVTLIADEQRTFDLACPVGKRVFGGGYDIVANAAVIPLSSYPSSQTAWRVVIRLSQPAGATFQFRIYAVSAVSN
jgi:hypothetical protein